MLSIDGMNILFEAELIFRIILSCLCGILIGYERKSRGKGAGIRTHMIVALAASLMMIISKYGFADLAGNADGSRIAAQIVSGVGFLGAGMIYVHKNSINGLTTAAGIWATSGIGMAMGAGMYVIAIATAAFIVLMQVFLHRDHKSSQTVQTNCNMCIEITDSSDAIEYVRTLFEQKNWYAESFNMKHNDGAIIVEADIVCEDGIGLNEAADIMRDSEYVLSVKF